jgi:hypothetical protein
VDCVKIGGVTVRLGGMAKGSGMIHGNYAWGKYHNLLILAHFPQFFSDTLDVKVSWPTQHWVFTGT